MYSRDELKRDFEKLGVVPGDIVMLHASVRSVGAIAGGPDQIHLALRDALTDEGTLLMYASVQDHIDDVGRGHLTAAEEAEILEKVPAFDPLTTRSARDNGILVEFFRTYPGARVNPHPARFVAAGKHVDQLFAKQPWHNAFGRESALERLVELKGKILLLGCDHDNTTFLHYAEHVVEIEGKRIARFRVPVHESGRRVWKEMEEVDTSSKGAHPRWPERFFAMIVDGFIERERIRSAKVGDSTAYLLPCGSLLEYALAVMKEVAAQ